MGLRRRTTLAGMAMALALVQAGCGLGSPGYEEPSKKVRETGDDPPPTLKVKERTDTPATVESPRSSATAAAREFAKRWINWSYRDAAAQQRALARLATGRLSESLAQNARDVGQDQTLKRDRLANRGEVVTVDVKGGGEARRVVLVAHEEASARGRAGLEGRRYRVYLGRVKKVKGGWSVSRWEPQL